MIKDNRIRLEMLDLGNPKIEIHHHKSLKKDFIISPKLRTLLSIDPELVYSLFPLIFLRKSNQYYLVARHWVYSLYFSEKNEKISIIAAVFQDEKMIAEIQRYELVDRAILGAIKPAAVKHTGVKSGTGRSQKLPSGNSRKSKSAKDSFKSGRLCPYHKNNIFHVLSAPRKKEKPDREGLIHIRCVNRSKGCNFDCPVTPYELDLLKKQKYATTSWFAEIPGSLCPKCNIHPIYIRTLRWGKNSVEKYKVCRNYYSIKDHCDYRERI